jgi:hypothetical protein
MIARKYDRIIEVWQTANVDDGFGGIKTSEALLGKSWCHIRSGSGSSSRLTDLGVTDIANTIIVNLRHRNDLKYSAVDMFFVYKGEKYIINTIVEKDLSAIEIEITATRNG